MNFPQAVYSIVRKILCGRVLTYGQIAKLAGFPGAARAVGTLMKKNFDPGIPCHRVIYADGRLGPYNRGGTRGKERLLKQEGVVIIDGRVRIGKY